MPWMTAAAIVGTSLLGADAARSAGNKQADAANRAADLQNRQYEQTRQDQMPFLEAGKGALNKLIPLASNYTPFSYSSMTADPGYQFRLSEGMRALGHKAGAGGGLVSGQSLKGLQDYAQGSASNEYTNAFNRYQAERQARLGPLQSLAGVGQTTATTLGQVGASNAANIGNLMTGGAAAQAAGGLGQVNALTGGLGTYLSYGQNQARNSLLQQSLDRYTPNYGQYTSGSNAFVGPMQQSTAPNFGGYTDMSF
jgi:hypothetical protein